MISNTEKVLVPIFIVLGVLMIVPFIYISQFVYLSSDDFCRAVAGFENYFVNISEWYDSHNGRFVNSWFAYLPVYELDVYRTIIGISIVLFGLTIFIFIKRLTSFYSIKVNFPHLLLLSVLYYILVFAQLPSINDFFYWFAGMSAYMYSLIFFMFFLIALMGLKTEKNFQVIKVGVLCILLIGSHEMLLLLVNFILLLLLLFKIYSGAAFKKILLLNCISLLTSLVVLLSPATINRQNSFTAGGDFFFSVKSAFLSSGMFTVKSLFEFPYIILFLVTFMIFLRLPRNSKSRKRNVNPVIAIILSFLGLVSVFVVPYYATGVLEVNNGRVANFIHFMFTIFLFFNIVHTADYFYYKIRPSEIKGLTLIQGSLIFIFILGIIISNKNYSELFTDLKENAYVQYNEKMQLRENLLRKSSKKDIVIDRLPNTRIIKQHGLSNHSDYWVNECYVARINRRYNKNFISISVE